MDEDLISKLELIAESPALLEKKKHSDLPVGTILRREYDLVDHYVGYVEVAEDCFKYKYEKWSSLPG